MTTRSIVTLTAHDFAGHVTNVTRIGMSPGAAALWERTDTAYDSAGRPAWTRGGDGIRTDYAYGATPEGGETRTTIRAAGTDCAVTNVIANYRDGTMKSAYLNGRLVETRVHDTLIETAYEGPNGTASPRWSRSERDLLGRTVTESRPGYGASLLVSTNAYNGKGQLVRSSACAVTNGATSTLSQTLYTYDIFGENELVIADRNFDGAIDWCGPDVIASNATAYVNDGGAWWRENARYAIDRDDSAVLRFAGATRSRLTGLGNGLAAETVSIDIRGNATTNRTYRNRASAEEITWRKLPTSSTPMLTIATNGLVRLTVSETGVTNSLAYDGFDRPIAKTDGRGNVTRTEYDTFGRISRTIDALGNATTYDYDALNRQIAVIDPLTNTTYTAYDAESRIVRQWGATYPVAYEYDAYGNKVSMTTYRNEDLIGGDTTRWLYDEPSGCMTNKLYADGKGPSYDYTPDGKLATRTWARGIVTTYSYDSNGALTNTVYSDDTPTISLVYNRAGQQVRAEDAAGVTTFLYDDFGAVTNETVIGVAGTNTIERYYDSFGRDAGYALNGVRQSMLAYDHATGRLASMQIPAIEDKQNHCPPPSLFSTFQWTYLVGSDLKSSLTYPNGLTASWQYDANNQLLQVCNATPTNIISQYGYTYDAAGRRINVSKTGTAFTQADSIAYGYNDKGELTNALAAVDSDYRYAYDFDDIGNRETSSERGTNSVYAANYLNQYITISNFVSSVSFVANEFAPQFDDDGNQTLIKTATGIWQVQYNGENRPVLWTLLHSSTPNSSTPPLISMSYDRIGRRVTKNNQRFVYNGYLQMANFEHQTSTNKLQTFIWDPSEPVATRPLVWSRNGALSFYTHDGNKNASEVVCANGMVDSHYDYAPFGALTQAMGECAFNNPWRFSCEYVDDDTFLIYYNYRHYNPVDGCWLTRDLIEEDGGLCLYAFCCNNVSLIDNLGLDCLDNLSNFAAGVGDSLSFGLSKALRKGISKLFFDDLSDPADTASKEYVYGEVTETVVEIAITLGGATLRHVAKHTARGAIEGGARQAYRRRHNLIGKGGFVHHVNPIKGHPNGKGAMFPLPFRWAARTDLNMKWYATKAEHLAAHKRLMFEDDLERFRILTTLPRATINACVQHLNNEVGEGCWDSLEVNGAVNIYDSNVNVNAVPESISFSLIEGAW